jgi:hypothetical protein
MEQLLVVLDSSHMWLVTNVGVIDGAHEFTSVVGE